MDNGATNSTIVPTTLFISEEERREYLQQLQEETTLTMIPAMVAVILMAVVGLIGNSLVLYVYSSKFILNGTRVFILVIATIDLVANIVVIPGEVYNMFHNWDFNNRGLCRVRFYINGLTTIASAQLLSGLAVVRYRKVCAPFGWQITAFRAKILVFVLVASSAVFSIPYAILKGRNTRPTPRPEIFGHECATDDSYVRTIWPMVNSAFFVLLFIANCSTIVVLYTLVGIKAIRHGRRGSSVKSPTLRKASTSSSGNTKHSIKKDKGKKSDKNEKKSEGGENEPVVCVSPSQRSVTFSEKRGPKRMITFSDGDEEKGSSRNYEDGGVSDCEESSMTESEAIQSSITELEGQCEGEVFTQGVGEKGKGNGEVTNEKSQTSDNTEGGTEGRNGENKEHQPNEVKSPKSKSFSLSRSLSRENSFLFKNRKLRKSSSVSLGPKHGLNRTSVMLITISAVYIIGFLPFLALNFYFTANPEKKKSLSFTGRTLYNLFLRSTLLNCAANAVIYYVCDLTFRSQCVQAIRRILFCSKSQTISSSSI